MKTTNCSGVDYVSAPQDYAELRRIYYPYVVALVHRMGIERSCVEDVACDILLRFQERGFLDKFDPTLTFHHGGRDHPARFKSFLSNFVMSYVRGYRDRQFRLRYREPLLCDRLVSRLGEDFSEHPWIDVFGETTPDPTDAVIDEVDHRAFIASLREYLTKVPRRTRYDACDLPALFDAVIAQIDRDGEITITELCRTFGICGTAMHGWVWWLRANLSQITGVPLPARRSRTLPATPPATTP